MRVVPPSSSCPRCGMCSAHPDDIREGWCGHCHDWTRFEDVIAAIARGDAAGAVWGAMQAEQELTPEVLLAHPAWRFEYMTADEAVFAFSPLNGPWVSSWRPDASLGPFTATWDREDLMKLSVRRDVIARAAAGMAAAALYRSRQLGGALAAVIAELRAAPQLRDRPDASPLDDIRAAQRLIEEQARIYQAQAAAARDPARYFSGPGGYEETVAAIARGGYSIDTAGHLTAEQCEALNEQIQRAERALRAEVPRRQEDRPPRPAMSRARRLREHQALMDRTEELLKRLDGEGYGVIAKADRADAEAGLCPVTEETDGQAMYWQPGDPEL